MTTPAAIDGDCGCAETGAVHFRATVDNTPWDGGAAMSGCVNSSGPATCFSRICACRKAGDPSKAIAWALPHHKNPGSPPNAAGVRNALSRLPQTDGLTNKAAAQQHLEAHLSAINAKEAKSAGTYRRAAAMEHPEQRALANGGGGRLQAFPASALRATEVVRDGQKFFHVEGYATVFDAWYEMFDMFGPYDEQVGTGALDSSLARPDLDTAFLTNHRGVTMARTTNRSLSLVKDGLGLAIDAYLNASRQDVRDLVSAIIDELVTEMSFAFWLRSGSWNDDYDQFTITDADIHRGDVSAVNYGANPYTSVAARQGEILAALDHLPGGAARAAMVRLAARPDVAGAGMGIFSLEQGSPMVPLPPGAEPTNGGSGGIPLPVASPPQLVLTGDRMPARAASGPIPAVPTGRPAPPVAQTGLSVQMLAAMQEADNAADLDDESDRW